MAAPLLPGFEPLLRWLSRLLPGRGEPPVAEDRVGEWMREAYRRHQAGDLEGATQGYRRILQHRPADADALFLLGEIANREGKHEQAAELLAQAVAANGKLPAFHHELGAALQACGRLEQAAASYRRTLELERTHLAALVDLAGILVALGLLEEAAEHCRRALELEPRAVAAHVNLGLALESMGQSAAAADSYAKALEIDSDCVQAHCNLSALRLKQGRIDDAQRGAERALALDPAFFEAHVSLGNILLERKNLDGALASFREALRLRPGSPLGQCNIGYALERQGDVAGAMRCYERAIELDPRWVQAYINRSGLFLLQENFAAGWEESEWRLRLPENAPVHQRFPVPRWDGGPLAGKAILVYGEQGLGDEIMYASCLPQIIAQAGRCVIDCDPRLEPLFRRSFPAAEVHGGKQSDPADWLARAGWLDVKISTCSLPLHLRRSATDFPRHEGYLRAGPHRVEWWRKRLQALGPGRKIGLSWRGGVQKTGRVWRSLDLAQMTPVLAQRGASFVCLQYGECGEELARLEREHGIRIHYWPEAIENYDETAALVCALDLTLSVCTALVHLAGALGRPVWVMAPVRPEARYGLRGAAMRWYPSVRMFRQTSNDAWDPVIESVARELPGYRAP